jgi:tRNA A37 threonylcarbamoyladenosine dehydratase
MGSSDVPEFSTVSPDDCFGGTRRLFGHAGYARLQRARVLVVGIGGVGSWAAEALARAGIGRLHLMDLDDLCVSNLNRQIHALHSTIGQQKVEAMAERCRLINPQINVTADARFFTEATAASILEQPWDYVVDAIDHVPNKCLLIAACLKRQLPIVTAAGAGGRTDPQRIQVIDLAKTRDDPLAAQVRKRLRKVYGFARGTARWGIPCVTSDEPLRYPQSDGTICNTNRQAGDMRLNCDNGFGTAAFVTGSFGLFAASVVVRHLCA